MQSQLSEALTDKYEIIRWIGGGGMAEVYLARHRIHGALFAVKVLSLDLAQDERIVARFVQEARTAATLAGHPNIVPIFDIGATNGLYYLIMQYIDGEDLSKHLRRNQRVNPQDAARITCQVADALAWASARGVVHRDLKPSNLYLDKSGRVMVLDFGIAKATDVPSALTAATERLGTTYYMSPEQIRGETCDVRSDLYSLGIVLFELLSGKKPFDGDSYRAIEIAHIEARPPDLAQIDRAIPPELIQIAEKLLAKSPGQRYQRAEDLIADLNRFGAGQTPLGIRPNGNVTGPGDETALSDASHGTASRTPSGFGTAPQQAASAAADPTNPTQHVTSKSKSNTVVIGAIIVVALLVCAAGFLYWRQSSRGAEQANAGASTTAAQPGTATLPKVKLDKLGNTMALVSAGKFIFGNDSDPRSPNGKEVIDLPAFYVDETEVSNASYAQFCKATGHKPPPSADFQSQPDLPVTNVSEEDAEAYAAWINQRLPTEKEWEKAARGTDGRIYPWGNTPWSDAPKTLQPVLSYPKRVSPYGAYNMAGNVAEWTTTHFPVGAAELQNMQQVLGTKQFSHEWRVIKGGYFGPDGDIDEQWRCYMRRGFPKDISVSDKIGFRCVADAQ